MTRSLRIALLFGCAAPVFAGCGLSAGAHAQANSSHLAACPVPSSKPDGRTYYVDPVHGSDAGNGSRARPWRSLSGGFGASQAKSGVVRGGDTVLLLSGEYGDLNLSLRSNSDFVTIAAAPGAQPRFKSISLSGAEHFLVRGVTVESGPEAAKVNLPLVRANGNRTRNIRLEGLTVGSPVRQASVGREAWGKTARYGVLVGGTCSGVVNSRIHDVRVGIVLDRVTHAIAYGNTIDRFSIDGIDFSGTDVVIRRNTITNHTPVSDGLHPDCFQSQVRDVTQPNGPVEITGNSCLVTTGKKPDPSLNLQGISIFTGWWRDVTIRCNLVVPYSYHGISAWGLQNAVIENNVVLGDDPTDTGAKSDMWPWVSVKRSVQPGAPKDGRIVVRNNFAPRFLNDPGADHSIEVKDATFARNTIVALDGKTGNIKFNSDLPRKSFRGPVLPRDAEALRRQFPVLSTCS